MRDMTEEDADAVIKQKQPGQSKHLQTLMVPLMWPLVKALSLCALYAIISLWGQAKSRFDVH